MRSTVVVVTWRARDRIAACLAAVDAQDRPHRTLVVDNASTDGTAELLAGRDVLRLPANAGYAGGLAAALEHVDTEFVVWLNDDALPSPGWLAALEDAVTPETGAVAGRLGDGLGVRLTAGGYGADTGTTPVFGFCGGGALVRTNALRAVGGVPGRFFCYYEDTDTSWRLRLAGWRIATAPSAVAAHDLGASTAPGSWKFHRWNERNRLWMLLRCAPLGFAVRQTVKFTALTVKFVLRPGDAPNHRAGLRLLVCAELLASLPRTVAERRAIGRRATVPRAEVFTPPLD
jgi:GT2 family glycosyltransferase